MSFERTIQMENHIILPVFGQFDANIKKIEKACGVIISPASGRIIVQTSVSENAALNSIISH